MMEAQLPRRRRFALVTFACLAVGLLASAPAALAVHSDQYDAFQNSPACPTASPYLNEPQTAEVACLADTASHALIKVGNFETEVSTPTTFGFAFATQSPFNVSCPAEECFDAVPGSTVLDVPPLRIGLPLGGHRPPHLPEPPHGWHWGWPGHGKVLSGRKLLHGPSDPSIKATIETAGSLGGFAFSLEPSGPILRAPFKIHLEGHLLGEDCYIGSNANPIVFAPVPIAEPELALLDDPNGLPVVTVTLNGLDIASNTFSVPAAEGCGPAVGPAKHKSHPLDGVINSALGLPSPAGQNVLALTGTKAALVVALEGRGAMLQSAFDAAQAP